MPVSYLLVHGRAQVIWLTVAHGEGFIPRWVNSSDSLWMTAYANVSTEVLTGELQFGLGAGRDGCPFHKDQPGGRDYKVLSENHVEQQNTWKETQKCCRETTSEQSNQISQDHLPRRIVLEIGNGKWKKKKIKYSEV